MTQATFTTETGSKYRVDYVARTCERLTGKSQATTRVGSGARRFESITDLQVGAPVLINWGEFSATPSQTEGADPCTLTSHVIKIELDLPERTDPSPPPNSSIDPRHYAKLVREEGSNYADKEAARFPRHGLAGRITNQPRLAHDV